MRTDKVLAPLLVLLSTQAFAQNYNAATGEIEMPGSPSSPTSPAQCDKLAGQWAQLQQQLDAAHQRCLDAHQIEPEDPRASFAASNPICSHAACQSLHANRLTIGLNGTAAVNECHAQVAIHQRQSMQPFAAPSGMPPATALTMDPAVQGFASPPPTAPVRSGTLTNVAHSLATHADEMRQLLADREAQFASAPTDSTLAEFAPTTDNTIPGRADSLDTAANAVHLGNPPDTLGDSWEAGTSFPAVASGFYDRQLYVWQFLEDGSELCPPTTISGVTITLSALFQEVATVHYHVDNALIDHSVIDKQRQFIRCIPAGNTSYPKYRSFPYYLKTPTSAADVRG
jgi:hypothetical protein